MRWNFVAPFFLFSLVSVVFACFSCCPDVTFHPRNTILGHQQAQGIVIKEPIIFMIGPFEKVSRLDDDMYHETFYADDARKGELTLNGRQSGLLRKIVLSHPFFS